MSAPAARGSAVAATLVALTIACLSASVAPASQGPRSTESAVRQSAARSDALDGCVRSERRRRPDLSRTGAAVRCARLASATIDATARWTTCARWKPAPGERCETGSARIAFRSERTQGDPLRRLPTPPGGRSWHVLGTGTVACTRERHDLAPGDRGAARKFQGTVDHLDAAVWPMRGDDAVRAGISIVSGGGYSPRVGSAPRDASACYPLRAEGHPPAALTLRAAGRLGDADGTVSLSRTVDASSPELGRLAGSGRLRLVVQGRTTMTFGVKDWRP